MVARDVKRALPKSGLPKAPTLLDCFLEALAKREARDHDLKSAISPSAISPCADPTLSDTSASESGLVRSSLLGPNPTDQTPSPAIVTQPDLFSR
jgi:hypothetical protein